MSIEYLPVDEFVPWLFGESDFFAPLGRRFRVWMASFLIAKGLDCCNRSGKTNESSMYESSKVANVMSEM